MMSELDYLLKQTFNEARSKAQSECNDYGAKLLDFRVSGTTTTQSGFTKYNIYVKIDITGIKKDHIEWLKSNIQSEVYCVYTDLLDKGLEICGGDVKVDTVGKPKGLFW